MSECSPGPQEICPRSVSTVGRQWAAGARSTCAQHPLHPSSPQLSTGEPPLCLSSLAGASRHGPRAHSSLPCGTLSRWTYQELVADSEPPHCRCFWGAGSAPPGSPGRRPGVNVQPRRPLPGHRCVTGRVWMPAACPGSWGSGMCMELGCVGRHPPPARCLVAGGCHLFCTLAVVWNQAGSPRARGCPCFGITGAGCAELLFAT